MDSLNRQDPEPAAKAATTIEVHSIFNTIQGEGPFSGEPALFVRLAGCNLQCPQCDTDYTSTRRHYALNALATEIQSKLPPNKLLVVTGGEPFRQAPALGYLTRLLIGLDRDVRIQIESNGTLECAPMPLPNVSVVISPKTHRVHPTLLPYVVAVKYVVDVESYDDDDGLPVKALDHPTKNKVWRLPEEHAKIPIYLQPTDNDNRRANTHHVVSTCMRHGYRVCLQQHKILGLE